MSNDVTEAMKRLDGLGATYREILGHPGRYEARWPAEYASSGYARWACSDAAGYKERRYARAFMLRAAANTPSGAPAT